MGETLGRFGARRLALVVAFAGAYLIASAIPALALTTGTAGFYLVQPDGTVLDGSTGTVLTPTGRTDVVEGRLPGEAALHTVSVSLTGSDAAAGVLVVPVTWDLPSAGTLGIWFRLDTWRADLAATCDISIGCQNQPDNWIFRYDITDGYSGDLQLRYWRSGVLLAGYELCAVDIPPASCSERAVLVDARVAFDPAAQTTPFDPTEWHFYTMVWAAGTPVQLFVDGQLVGTSGTAEPAGLTSTAPTFSLGGWPGAYSANGAIADSQSYSTPLADTIVAEIADPTAIVVVTADGVVRCMRLIGKPVKTGEPKPVPGKGATVFKTKMKVYDCEKWQRGLVKGAPGKGDKHFRFFGVPASSLAIRP